MLHQVLVPDPKPTPEQITFSVMLYWKQYMCRMRSGDETVLHQFQYRYLFTKECVYMAHAWLTVLVVTDRQHSNSQEVVILGATKTSQ